LIVLSENHFTLAIHELAVVLLSFFLSNLINADQDSIIVSSRNLSLPFRSPETRSFWYSLALQELVLELLCSSFEFAIVGHPSSLVNIQKQI
jgi:hypothetical protein